MTRSPQPKSRRAERVHARIPVTLLPDPGSEAEEKYGTTLDVSPQGARILTEAVLTPGDTLRMVSLKTGTQPVRARVVWVSVEPDEPTQAGLEFLD